MKNKSKIYTIKNKRLVMGDSNLLTKDEVLLIQNPSGSIRMYERDLNNKIVPLLSKQ